MGKNHAILRPVVLAFSVVIVAGCGDDDGATGLDPSRFELVAVAGDAQSGLAGTVLPEPLVVAVNEIAGGASEGVTVSWSVSGGSGTPTRSTSVTDADGLAATRLVLGDRPGPLGVQASVAGLEPVTFRELTVQPAPVIESVTPSDADPGDTLEVKVRDLPIDLSARVLFDGVAAEIVSRQDGAPAILRAVVPPPAAVCSSSSTWVDVRVRAGGLASPAEPVLVRVPADPFRIGQVLVIEGTSEVRCALLPAGAGDAGYLLVVLSTQFETSGQVQVTLGSSTATVSPTKRAAAEVELSFHDRLRALEHQLSAQGLALSQSAAEYPLFAEPVVGDRRQFWVINNPRGALPGRAERDFDRVTATLRYVGGHTLLYLDEGAPEPGLTEADLQSLGELYDHVLYEANLDYFGEPSDVDSNRRVIVLLSPVVNGLTPRGSLGITVGFFFGLDLCSSCQFSNRAEILYGIVPDEAGSYSDRARREFVLSLLPGVMAHETEHMINFNVKADDGGGGEFEELWLSEGLAHMAEELAGDAALDAGEAEFADDLYRSDLGLAARFLEDPGASALTAVQGSGSSGERGAAWLFLRWLGENYGDFIFRELARAPESGVANVEARTGERFFRLFADWAVTAWADDLTIPGLGDRYQIPKWDLRTLLRKTIPGGGSDYILRPRALSFAELRSSTLVEFMSGSSPLYVELNADGDTAALQLDFRGGGLAILRVN